MADTVSDGYDTTDWIPVSSSNVEAVRWSSKEGQNFGEIQVRFHSGGEYTYPGKAKRVFDDMLTAPSKGRYVWGILRDDPVAKRYQKRNGIGAMTTMGSR